MLAEFEKTNQNITNQFSTDRFLKEYFKENGYDKLPQKVSNLDDHIKAGDKVAYRGVGNTTDADSYIDQFKNGEYFVGKGMYGDGIQPMEKKARKLLKDLVRLLEWLLIKMLRK